MSSIEPAPRPETAEVPASFDAQVWAREFLRLYEASSDEDGFLSEANLVGWFANAIMRGFDEAQRRAARPHAASPAAPDTGVEKATCTLCGEPMPPGEEMFHFHGYSGPCPKPPLPKAAAPLLDASEINVLLSEHPGANEYVAVQVARRLDQERAEHRAALAEKDKRIGEERAAHEESKDNYQDLLREAHKRIAELEAGLLPFAREAADVEAFGGEPARPLLGDLRKARALLSATEKGSG